MTLQIQAISARASTVAATIPKLQSCDKCCITDPCSECKAVHYVRLCETFGTRVDPSVVSTILTNWNRMQVTARSATDVTLVPLALVLGNLNNLKSLSIGSHESFAYRGDGNWICRSLSAGLPQLTYLRVLDMQRLGIDGHGLEQIAESLSSLPKLTELILRHNYLGYNNGTDSIVHIVRNASDTLRFIDISCNSLGYYNVRKIEQAARETRKAPVDLHLVDDEPRVTPPVGDSPKHAAAASPPHSKRGCCGSYEIDVEGNFVVEEVWNSVLHGIGAILAIIGTFDLTNKAKGQTEKIWWACLVYGLSGTCLFTASTLYHSSFLHERARRVFQMLDHSAIFILIAGTYTPIGLIALSNVPEAVMMVTIEWLIALVGITVYLVSAHFPRLVKSTAYIMYEVVLYVVMGHLCLISYEAIIVTLDKDIRFTLLLGGALYIVGVIFFVLEQVKRIPIMHCVWHIFVLTAAICHYFSVRWAVESRLYESTHSAAAIAARGRSHILMNPFPSLREL